MEPKKPKMRKHLCLPGLLQRTKRSFDRIKDPIKRKTQISLTDCLMSGLAMFSLKYPSLLQFENAHRSSKLVKHNLRTLYGVNQAPSDTYLRERLDEIECQALQKSMDRLITQIQRGKILEQYRYMDDYCLVSLDGTGFFSSKDIHCESCCVKNHRDGTVTYYHQMLAAVMVHPSYNTVFPLALEPIQKQDGATKNDCEHNAAKRLLKNLRTSHPHLKMIIVLDGLYADGPIIKLLKELKFPFIITAKENDLKYLFEFHRFSKNQEIVHKQDKKEFRYAYSTKNPLNDTHPDLEVNVLEFFETAKTGEKYFCWITDLTINKGTVELISKGGRCRWRIENETFNTLKNQGYQFEHNFGHGNKYLSTVFAYLMFQAFLIDQIQQFCCKYFKAALEKCSGRTHLWEKIRGYFFNYFIETWDDLYTAIIGNLGGRLKDLLDTS